MFFLNDSLNKTLNWKYDDADMVSRSLCNFPSSSIIITILVS